jgi:hypothetical protein
VNYFTLRIINTLMETIKDLYISAHRLRLAIRCGTQSRILVPYIEGRREVQAIARQDQARQASTGE